MTISRKLAGAGVPARAWGLGGASLLLAAMAACGGNSGGSYVSPLAGVWSTTAAGGGTTYALVMVNGDLRILNPDYSMVAIPAPALRGTHLAGTGYLYLPGPIAPSAGPQALTVAGTGISSALDLNLTDGAGNVTTLNLTPDTAAGVKATLATLAGSYTTTGTASDGVGGTVTLTAAGVLTGNSPLETLSGTVTPVATGLNAFTVAFTYDGVDGSSTALTGTAFYRPSATAGQLVLMSDNGTVQFSGIFNGSAGTGSSVKTGEARER